MSALLLWWSALGLFLWALLGLHLFERTWEAYLAIMHVKLKRDTVGLSKLERWASTPMLLRGYAYDWLLNVFWFSFVCLDFHPARLGLLSPRLGYYLRTQPTGWLGHWRVRVARFCEPALDKFDPSGNHI